MPTDGQKALAARIGNTGVKSSSDTGKLAEQGKSRKGMAFVTAASAIAKRQGISADRARRIVAAGAQQASPAAKRANPNLKKVATKGSKKTKGGTYK